MDSGVDVGGAIDTTIVPLLSEIVDTHDVQVVSSDPADDGTDGNQITVYSRDNPSGVPNTMTGQTPNAFGSSFKHLFKTTLSFAANGDVAVEDVTAEHTGTAASGTQDDITLDAGASAVDNAYRNMVIRETNGAKRIRRVIAYNGTTKVATVSRAWGGSSPTSSTTFRISRGTVHDADTGVVQVIRPVTRAGTSGPYYDKVFIKNTNGTTTATSGQVAELVGGAAAHTEFALATSKNDSGDNGFNDFTVAPSSGVTAFDSSAKGVPGGGSLAPGDRIGVWLKYHPNASEDTVYSMEFTSSGPTLDFDLPLESQGTANFSYTASGGVKVGGAAITSFVPSPAHNYITSGGVKVRGAADVTAVLTQVSFDIFNALSKPCAVFFDIVKGLQPPESIGVSFDIFEGVGSASVSFDIFSDKMKVARSQDVQMPIAKWEIH
jgi:hypothetical protein